jgi:conjugal transfer ATP-binding protein TraC
MPRQVKPTVMFLVLDYVYSKMKEDLSRKLLVVDEAWSLLSRSADASYILEIVKTCRKFNLGLLLINQEVEDMLNSKAGRSVLANTSYTLLLRQKPAVIENVQKTFNLSNSERISLLTALPGEGILIMENEHSKLKIIASKKEDSLITTNADEILKRNNGENQNKSPQKIKPKKNVDVQVDVRANFFNKRDLSQTDIDYLKKKGYIEFEGYSITSDKKEDYLIKPRFNESPPHCFVTYDIANYLKKFKEIKNIRTFETKRPDILFTINDKDYAIEVETGKMLTHNKTALMEKIEANNKEYGDRWFFMLTNRKIAAKYSKLHETCDKRYVINKITKLIKNNEKIKK